jgi:hypothetical protein
MCVFSQLNHLQMDTTMYRLAERGKRLHVYLLTSDAQSPPIRSHDEGDSVRIFDHATMWSDAGDDNVTLFTDILSDGRIIENQACISIEEMFRLGDDLMCVNHGNNITMSPIWSPNASVLLCEPSRRRNVYVYTAVMNSHTYVSAWGAGPQHRESRDICTIVDFHVCDDERVSANISTGFYPGSMNRTNISLLDPRQNAAPQIVYYSDCDNVEIPTIRDVPNGTMVLLDSHIVTLFDHRACAMIGTDIILGYSEYMF